MGSPGRAIAGSVLLVIPLLPLLTATVTLAVLGLAPVPDAVSPRPTPARLMAHAAGVAGRVGVRATSAAGIAAVVPTEAVPVGQGVWPLSPRPPVVRGFDPPDSPYGRGHRGVDLLGVAGQVVRTSLAGRVTFAGSLAGRGVVVVDHGAVRTTYEPVTASVPVGAAVARGQPIGTLQTGGSHCAPRACLHWGLLEGSTYLDPLLLVGGFPVRLLPLSP